MDAVKTAYELDFWKAVRTGHIERYAAILYRWGISAAESVLEIGTGPLGGCLPFIDSRRRVGLDPLYGDYEAAGLLERHDGIEYVTTRIEDFETREKFAAVISMNALDHGKTDFSSLDKIASLMAPGGRFYLHVHLRTAKQLNIGHDHSLRLEDLIAAVDRNGLVCEWAEFMDRDPIEGRPYKTVIGVWHK